MNAARVSLLYVAGLAVVLLFGVANRQREQTKALEQRVAELEDMQTVHTMTLIDLLRKRR